MARAAGRGSSSDRGPHRLYRTAEGDPIGGSGEQLLASRYIIAKSREGKRCSNRLVFAAFTPTAGVRISDTWHPTSIWSASGRRNSWNGNISLSARGSNA